MKNLINETVKQVKIYGLDIPYLVSKRKVKNARIEIKNNQVVIVLPPWMKNENQILKENAKWVYNKFKMIHSFDINEKATFIFGEPWAIQESSNFTLDSGQKIIHFNKDNPLHKKHLSQTFKRRLSKKLEEFTIKYKEKYDFEIKSVRINKTETQWGSCSGDNTLRFNLRMCVLPLNLIDYVVFHELIHTIHKNHGPNFKRFIEKEFPLFRSLDKKLHLYWIRSKKLLELIS